MTPAAIYAANQAYIDAIAAVGVDSGRLVADGGAGLPCNVGVFERNLSTRAQVYFYA